MTQKELNEVLRRHKLWLVDEDSGERADLRDANLRGKVLRHADLRRVVIQRADLRGADLRDANLDYSCLPLWCGGSWFKADVKLVYQILAHVATIQCDDPEFEEIRQLILPFAKKSHRAQDLNLFDDEE